MKRLLTRLIRFFWSWGFLKFLLFAITLVLLLYAEEDWRGARAWAATKAKWEAKGESLDYYGKFIPPPIPNVENLAAVPLFKMEADPRSGNTPQLLTLERAMRSGHFYTDPDLPSYARWQIGETNDPQKLQRAILTEFTSSFKGTVPPQSPLDQFEALFPFLSELRAEAATRPYFRLELDYSFNPPDGRALGPVTQSLRLSKILTLDALLALNDHKSALAVDDLKVNFQIAAGVKHDPTLVAALVAIGMTNIGHAAIFNGLAHHQWSDADLAKIESLLNSIHFLSDGQFAFRSEAASLVADIEYYRHSPLNIYGLLEGMDNNGTDRAPSWMVRFSPPWASGWWDQSKSQMADSILRAVAALDPQNHRVYPDVSRDLQSQLDQAKLRPLAYAPWNIWATLAVGPINGGVKQFPIAQAWVDEARIVCGLERYRLARGVYPNSLDSLVPAYIDDIPHDIMSGEPYHYRLNTDGTFLLYSVGWNQTDDGGNASYQYNNDAHQKAIDYDHGDWVWPTPRASTP